MSSTTQNIETDVVVIGSGPGGYVAAIRLGQLGKRVVLVEKEKLGGVCLNVGCIPSKALITASKLVKKARAASKMGIKAEIRVDLPELQAWKQSVVNQLTSGVATLCKTNGVKVISGRGYLVSRNEVSVRPQGDEGEISLKCQNVIIATGSSPVELQNVRFDGSRVITSTEALDLTNPPKSMLLVGGGVIGLEIGTAYSNLFGTVLTIVEVMDQILPGLDSDVVNIIQRNLQRLGAKIFVKSRVKSATTQSDKVRVIFETSDSKEQSVEVEYVLVGVGRKPNVKDLGLQGIGVKLSEKGFVEVDKEMRTNIPGIFAIGDVVGGPLLAHKASKEGIVAAEVICGMKSSADFVAMPSAIFTDPEIAVVGLNPAEATKQGINPSVGKFPFVANGKALASGSPGGFSRVVADSKTGLVIGAQIVGEDSTELISELSLAIEMGATLEDIALTVHPHPTLPEAIMESAENALGKAIHIQNKQASASRERRA